MSGADEPRTTEYWKTALILARNVIDDSGLLCQADADKLAEAVTERLLGDFLAMAEMSSSVMFGMDGTGPFCSWCGRMPGPRLPKGHFQYGVFCTCKRDPAEAAADDAEQGAA
jgi:hypothetical protein